MQNLLSSAFIPFKYKCIFLCRTVKPTVGESRVRKPGARHCHHHPLLRWCKSLTDDGLDGLCPRELSVSVWTSSEGI